MVSKFAAKPAQDDQQAAKQSLEGFYLIRGYSNKVDVMESLMDMPKEEAIAKMEKIHPTRGTGKADKDGNRDQTKYYNERKATDDWLRKNAHVTQERHNPIFFALTNDPDFVKRAMKSPNSDTLVVKIADADLSKFSFTYDDSMGNFFSKKGKSIFLPDKHPLHGTVMDANGIAAAIQKYGVELPGSEYKRTIEGQYWSKAPLKGEVVKGMVVPNPSQEKKAGAEHKETHAKKPPHATRHGGMSR